MEMKEQGRASLDSGLGVPGPAGEPGSALTGWRSWERLGYAGEGVRLGGWGIFLIMHKIRQRIPDRRRLLGFPGMGTVSSRLPGCFCADGRQLSGLFACIFISSEQKEEGKKPAISESCQRDNRRVCVPDP